MIALLDTSYVTFMSSQLKDTIVEITYLSIFTLFLIVVYNTPR